MLATTNKIARSEDYRTIISYVISNARMGEIQAVENYSEMVPLMPDTEAKILTVKQAHDEGKHILVLERLAREIDVPIRESIVQHQWNNIRAACHEAAQQGDLVRCLLVQDLMVEALAIGMYRVFSSAANSDGGTAHVAAQLLRDELDHLDLGVLRINEFLTQDRDRVHDSLRWAHHRVMPELFDMVYRSCVYLAEHTNVHCAKTDMNGVSIDLEMLKMAALDNYVEMLSMPNFDPAVINPLVASMSSYEPPASLLVGMPSTSCCATSEGNGHAPQGN